MKKTNDEETYLGSIGFMFDSEHKKEKQTLTFDLDIKITINLIGDNPGK